jgi:hypothetical protein
MEFHNWGAILLDLTIKVPRKLILHLLRTPGFKLKGPIADLESSVVSISALAPLAISAAALTHDERVIRQAVGVAPMTLQTKIWDSYCKTVAFAAATLGPQITPNIETRLLESERRLIDEGQDNQVWRRIYASDIHTLGAVAANHDCYAPEFLEMAKDRLDSSFLHSDLVLGWVSELHRFDLSQQSAINSSIESLLSNPRYVQQQKGGFWFVQRQVVWSNLAKLSLRSRILDFHEDMRQAYAKLNRDMHQIDALGRVGVWISEAPAQTLRSGVKVGRNDPCPCGSGRKNKHCCANSNSAVEQNVSH